jgi:hypothetical protein
VPALAVGLPLAVLAAFVLFLATYDGRKGIDLTAWTRDDAWRAELMPGARIATDELCDEDLPCVQAVASETVTMYRFAEQEQALATARRLAGEAYLSGWIVLHFEPGALTQAQRREIALSVDCVNVGITADGVEC